MTLTEIVQLAPAASVPAFKAIVDVPAVAVTVPPQVLVKPFGVLITSPPGSTSVKLTPVRALLPEVVLEIVKVNVLALPVEMGLVPKAFEIAGGGGFAQPVMVTSSRYTMELLDEGLPEYCAPTKIILKYIVLTLVIVEVALTPAAPVFQPLDLSQAALVTGVHVAPSVLLKTYQLSPFDQLEFML